MGAVGDGTFVYNVHIGPPLLFWTFAYNVHKGRGLAILDDNFVGLGPNGIVLAWIDG